MKILVTGGSGLVGKYIVNELSHHGHTVGVLDLVPPRQQKSIFHHVDVLNLADVVNAMKGYDAVVHSAGIPHPLNDPAERVFSVNVNGTFNILEAAARNGIKKVVFTSSESTLGFAFMTKSMVPEYVPIDEQHPLRPQDPYGLSKVVCEQICRSYSAQYGIRTVCLREPWIWVPEDAQLPLYRTLVSEYSVWYKNLWAYVHVFDVAQAHRLAVEQDLPEFHEVFFITAKQNWAGINSADLLKEHYSGVKAIRNTMTGPVSIISSQKAHHLLGYDPHYSVNDLLTIR